MRSKAAENRPCHHDPPGSPLYMASTNQESLSALADLVLWIYITHADKPLAIYPCEFVDFTTGRGSSTRCECPHPVSMVTGMVFVDEFNMGIRHDVIHAWRFNARFCPYLIGAYNSRDRQGTDDVTSQEVVIHLQSLTWKGRLEFLVVSPVI